MSLWKERFGVAPADPVVAFTESLSFDLRLSRHFALSPELFAWWHAVPNDRGRALVLAKLPGLVTGFRRATASSPVDGWIPGTSPVASG